MRMWLAVAGMVLGVGAGMGQARPTVPPVEGVWTAESPVAMAMTGDLQVSGGRLSMVGHSFGLNEAMVLRGERLQVAERLAGRRPGPEVAAVMVHVRETGQETSRLCSGRPVRWMVFVLAGAEMEMAAFAGERRLDLLMAEEREQRLCGVYRYARPHA